MIDKTGQWWKGDSYADVVEYITEYSAENYAAARIEQSRCRSCSGTSLSLRFDDEEGGAETTCSSCGTTQLLLDSRDYWEDANPDEAACPCGGEVFEIGVGFSLRDDGDVRWVYVGGRCVACGVLGVYTDWKIDYSPTEHLFKQV